MADAEAVRAIGRVLKDPSKPLKERFRALFTLRGLGGPLAIECIAEGFADESALLKHELAYCLGQMQDERAVPVLRRVLQDRGQEPMVRHEAGEALGAIGKPEVLEILREYSCDPVTEVAETCQLAVKRIEWLHNNKDQSESQYCSIDPAPPASEKDIKKLRESLLDESLPLFDRYRAMFALRNIGSKEAVLALGDDPNPLVTCAHCSTPSQMHLVKMTWACRTLVALLSISAVGAQDGGATASTSLFWQPWMTALTAVTVFLFIVFAGMIMNKVLCAKNRGTDESSTKLNIEERTSASEGLPNSTMDNDKITNL